jgi:S1-C subfamily serine protease
MPNPFAPFNAKTFGTWLLIVGVCISLGSAIGSWAGRELHRTLGWKTLRRLDNAGGSVLGLVTWSIALWVIASALGAAPIASTSELIGSSRIISAVDNAMPQTVRNWYATVRNQLSLSELPQNIAGVLSAPTIAAPTTEILKDEHVLAALSSIVRVEGVASSCKMRITGTGFVASNHIVITNAHVVAGTDTVGVRVGGRGALLSARVVDFDANTDIAVLYVKKLKQEALPIGATQKKGSVAVVAGFPGGGRMSLIPARIRDSMPSQGTDIYGATPVRRSIYSIRADIRQGDSGAPMIALDGSVVGLVFASSATDDQTGYALLPSAITHALQTSANSTNPVSTGKCVPE